MSCPGQQFATAHLSLIGVNSEKQRVTKNESLPARRCLLPVRGLSIEEIARHLRRGYGDVRDKVAEVGRACRG